MADQRVAEGVENLSISKQDGHLLIAPFGQIYSAETVQIHTESRDFAFATPFTSACSPACRSTPTEIAPAS